MEKRGIIKISEIWGCYCDFGALHLGTYFSGDKNISMQDFHSSCKHMHLSLIEYAVKNIRE